VKNRVHIDLATDDFDADLGGLRGLGASVLSTGKTPDGKPSAVLSDPKARVSAWPEPCPHSVLVCAR